MAGASHSGPAHGSLSFEDSRSTDGGQSPDGRIYVIEANPNPWLAPEAELAVAVRLAGRSYVELIGQIVELALARYAT
jgi:D-alanine-D-alanine ligase